MAEQKRADERSRDEQALEALLRAGESVLSGFGVAVRPYGISFVQYSVLRILQNGGQGLSCGAIGERLIQKDPDVTRLVDRLEKQGLVTRSRDAKDRRIVRVSITSSGSRLVKELDQPIRDHSRRVFGHLSGKKLQRLIRLLESIQVK